MNKNPQYNQQSKPKQCRSDVEEMCLVKGRNLSSLSENTNAMLENLSEETIFESSQIKE